MSCRLSCWGWFGDVVSPGVACGEPGACGVAGPAAWFGAAEVPGTRIGVCTGTGVTWFWFWCCWGVFDCAAGCCGEAGVLGVLPAGCWGRLGVVPVPVSEPGWF